MNYNLKKPCSNCPFRRDSFFPLQPDRVLEIVDDNVEFACHKTVDYSSGDGAIKKKSEHCAGLLIMLEKMEQPHQMMRICERIGLYKADELEMDSPVYDSVDEYIDTIEEHEIS